MIIEGLANVILTILDFIWWFELPQLPSEIDYYFAEITVWLSAGAGIIANYTPWEYLCILFGIILAIDIGITIYHLVMWVLRKIPMAAID